MLSKCHFSRDMGQRDLDTDRITCVSKFNLIVSDSPTFLSCTTSRCKCHFAFVHYPITFLGIHTGVVGVVLKHNTFRRRRKLNSNVQQLSCCNVLSRTESLLHQQAALTNVKRHSLTRLCMQYFYLFCCWLNLFFVCLLLLLLFLHGMAIWWWKSVLAELDHSSKMFLKSAIGLWVAGCKNLTSDFSWRTRNAGTVLLRLPTRPKHQSWSGWLQTWANCFDLVSYQC